MMSCFWGLLLTHFPTPCAFLALASTCFKNVKIPCLFSRLQLLVLQILFTFLLATTFPFWYLSIFSLLDSLTMHEYIVVQFYPWFKFLIPLFQIHYHTLQHPKKQKKQKKNWTKDKIEPQQIFQWKIASWPLFWVEGQRLNMCQQGRDLYPPTYLPLSGL